MEQAEVEEPQDPGIYPTTADLAGRGDQVHQQQAPVFQQPRLEGDYRHGPHQAVGLANTEVEHLEHNKKETVENEEDVKTDTLAEPDTGARVDCQGVMHEVEVNVLPDSTGGGGPTLKQ